MYAVALSPPPGARDPARKVAHLTPEERVARGKAARPDPVGLLEEQAASRVPELVPIRYGRMLVSPFTFAGGSRLSPQQTGCVNG
ncbi:MAG TPA: hypothetical protein VNB87_14275 [Propionibacteriaceae bacterium]|nr:hypothetical protein [Propionibacteriaceae bacterium]